jgi:hypothetical protein
MSSRAAHLELELNPALQELLERFRVRRQAYLEQLPGEKDSDERLRLSGRAQELKQILMEFNEVFKARTDLEATAPREEI